MKPSTTLIAAVATVLLYLGAAAPAAPSMLASPAWDTLSPLLQNRMEASIVGLADTVVVLGGNALRTTGGRGAMSWRRPAVAEPALNSTEILRNGRWSTGPAMLEARSAFAAAVLNGALYAFGGMASNLPGGVDPNVSATVEVLAPLHHAAAAGTGGWRPAPPLPYPTTGTHAVTLPGGTEVLLVGGFCSLMMGAPHCPGTTAARPWSYMNATLRFDGTKYTTAADLPCGGGEAPACGLANMALVACGGKVWSIGGVGLGPAYPDVFIYDVDADTWTAGPPLPAASSWAGAACIPGPAKGDGSGGSVMVTGGMDGNFNPSADVWTLDTAGDGRAGWVPGPPLPLPKGFTGAAVECSGSGCTVVVAGGSGFDVVFALKLAPGAASNAET